MWVADIRVWHKDSMVISKSRDLDVWYACYYLNAYEENGQSFVSRVILVFGKDAQKYIRMISEDKRVKYMHAEGNRVYLTLPVVSNFHALVMDRRAFFTKPTVVYGGYEYWQVGALDKSAIRELVDRVNRLKPDAEARLLKLVQKDVDFFLPDVFRRLSPKQRWAYEQACKYGYYGYPRENDLQTIARKLKVPETTFRIHLRLAESKLLPAIGELCDLGPHGKNAKKSR